MNPGTCPGLVLGRKRCQRRLASSLSSLFEHPWQGENRRSSLEHPPMLQQRPLWIVGRSWVPLGSTYVSTSWPGSTTVRVIPALGKSRFRFIFSRARAQTMTFWGGAGRLFLPRIFAPSQTTARAATVRLSTATPPPAYWILAFLEPYVPTATTMFMAFPFLFLLRLDRTKADCTIPLGMKISNSVCPPPWTRTGIVAHRGSSGSE